MKSGKAEKSTIIVYLVGAVVLMGILLTTVNVAATIGASLHGSASTYAPAWINASSEGQCMLQLDVIIAGAETGIDYIHVTFGNVSSFNATTDFRPLVNSTSSGVMLYSETTFNGFQGDEDTVWCDNLKWEISAGDTSYKACFGSPTGIMETGTKYVYVVVKTNISVAVTNDAKFNVSIAKDNIVGNLGYTAPDVTLYGDFTTTIDKVPPNDFTGAVVNNYTATSNWTNNPVFFVNWTGHGDIGSGVAGYYYKLDSAPTTYNDGIFTTGINCTVDLSSYADGDYPMYIWAVDYAHNKGNDSVVYLRYDTTAPTLSFIEISDTSTGNTTWTNALSVTLTLTATDSLSSMGIGAKMCFKNEVGGEWSSWETYTGTKIWSLGSGVADGTKTVYFKAKDVAGNENTTGLSDTIILDMTAPTIPSNGTVYLDRPGLGFATTGDNVTLWAIINDPTSGILLNATSVPYVTLNVTLLNSTLGWVQMVNTTGGNNFTCTVQVNWTTINTDGDGDKWLQINATDNATNSNQIKYILCMVDTTAPSVTANPTVYPTFTDALGYTVQQTNATNGDSVTLNVTVWETGTLKYIMVNVTNITTDSYPGVWVNPPGLGGRWVNMTQGAQINSTTYYYTATLTIGNALNGTHTLIINATDNLDNTNLAENVIVNVDNVIPNIANPWVNYNITVGAHPFYRTWAGNGESVTLNITVRDNATGSGISVVQVYVATLNASQTWINMSLGSGTFYDGNWISSVTLYGATNGTKQLQVKAWDSASNFNWTQYISVNVNNPPLVSSPAVDYTNYTWQSCAQNGTILNITVTVTDDDVSTVKIRLYDTSTNEYLTYLGGVWVNLMHITGTNTWYNNSIVVSATADGYYNLTINATDTAGNWNNTVNVTVKVDTTAPTSSTDTITPYWHNTLTVTATSNDPSTGVASGVKNVTLWYRYSGDNVSFGAWTSFGTSTTGSWVFTAPDGDGYYQFYSIATDNAGNVESKAATAEAFAGYDTVAPATGTPTLSGTEGEDPWYISDVAVTLTATDPSPSSDGLIIEYYVDSGDWITYTVAFTITTDGIHTVYYRTTDRAGNVESTKTQEVKVDKTLPTATSIVINIGDSYTNTESVLLTVSASDATSTVWKMSFKNEVAGTWGDWITYAEATAWFLLAGDDGMRTVYFKVKDYAGLESYVTSDTITLDKTAPSVSSTTPADTATGVSISENVVVIFDEAMNTSLNPTITETVGSVAIYTPAGWSGGNTFTWTHTDWTGDTDITLQVTNAKDVAGNTMNAKTWSFHTEVVVYTIDYVQIHNQTWNGPVMGAVGMTTDDTLTLWCAGYNDTSGFVDNVSATWAVTGGIGTVGGAATSTTFDATTVGSGTITVTTAYGNNATGTITVGVAPSELTPHDPISINGNSDFTAANGVTSGSGTESNPYIIENWDINASSAHGIYIINTDVYFIIRNCVVRDGKTHNNYGIYFYSVQNGKIENCTIYNNSGYGILLSSSSNNNISANQIYNNSRGIYLYDSSNNNQITACQIYNNTWSGIDLGYSSNNNQITNCYVYNNSDGIRLSSSSNNNLSANQIYNNSGRGIYLDSSSNNNITNCNISNNNDKGISIADLSCNNRITGCTISSNNGWGIEINTTADYNRIIECNISYNNIGINIGNGYTNSIYHNNFINNTIQTLDHCTNYWDNGYPSGGNYWSDYTGSDLYSGVNQDEPGSDGIGDTPYPIPGGSNQDNYPFMNPSGWEEEPGLTPHDPIYINGNSEFTEANGVTSGSGTQGDPYIIENWDIDAGWGIGIYIGNTDAYFIIRNCMIHNVNISIYFYNVTNGKIENCEIYDNCDYGIVLGASSNNNQITNCDVYNNSVDGISLASSSNNNISNCTVYNNSDYGICLSSSSNNNITNCAVYNNYDDGIVLDHSSNNQISNCAVYNNYYGIWLYTYYGEYNYNQITNCSVYNNNEYGIWLDHSSNNQISNCAVYNNYYGIWLYSSPNNLIYNNYFNNTNNAYSSGTGNRWNITKTLGMNIINGSYLGGNYWSDYTGTDSDGDGIGDTPYIIIPGGSDDQDHLPLLEGVVTYGVDYIQIRTASGGAGSVVSTLNLNPGGTSSFYVACYNNTSGYIGDSTAATTTWVSSAPGVAIVTSPANPTTVTAVSPGTSTITATDTTSGKTNTTTVNVAAWNIDYLQIHNNTWNGPVVGAVSMTTDDALTLWCAGYNNTSGFVGSVSATWGKTGTLDAPPAGPATNILFDPSTAGTSGTITATYAGKTNATGIIIVGVAPSELTPHDPIYIGGNSGFNETNGVTSGSGTQANPYIIENWDINASTAHGIEIRNTNVYFIIRNCVIHDGKNNNKYGIYFCPVSNGKIEDVTSYNNCYGICLDTSSNNNNQITNCNVYNNSHNGIYLYGSSHQITNCNVYNNHYGILLSHSSDSQITDCTVYNNNDTGIYLGYSANNQITNSNVYNNGGYGIELYSSSDNEVNYCNIYDNTGYGVYNGHSESPYVVDATYNWWGSADGPSGVGPGSGDAVSDNVLYEPWLTEPWGGAASQITGHVYISGTNTPIQNVNVSINASCYALTDANGKYTLSGIAPDTYTVTASATGYASSSESVTVSAGAIETQDFYLNPLSETGNITGVVKDENNNTISGATVTADGHSDTTDANGIYTISGVPAGNYNVTASKSGYVSSTQTNVVITAGNTTELNFILILSAIAQRSSISGTVKDKNGNPISGVTVTAKYASNETVAGTDTTDSNGFYIITDLLEGTYTVTASKSGYTPSTQTKTVTAGETATADFTLNAIQLVTETFEDPTTDATVTAQYTGTGTINIVSALSPGAPPSGMHGINIFVEITVSGNMSVEWAYIEVPYSEDDLPSGVDESKLRLFYWTGTGWEKCENTGVDTVNNIVWANISHLTIFAPMAEKAAAGEEGVEGGVGIGGYWWVAVLVVVIIVVMGVGYSRRKKMRMGRVVSAKPPPAVPKPEKPSRAEAAASRQVADLDERLGVLRGEIRHLIGYNIGDLKEEAEKIKGMIKDGYWVQAGNALATLEGKVMSRKMEKEKYDQFMIRVNELTKERADFFVDDIKAHLYKGDFDKAEQLLGERRRDYEQYLELVRNVKDVEEEVTMLSRRLAKGELPADAYERARDDLEKRKYDIDEKLWKIQRKIFREKYEKPF